MKLFRKPGFANDDIAALAESAQANDYVTKPFDLEDLEVIVAGYMKNYD